AAYNNGQPVAPEMISMMYWYPQTPTEPEVFDYSAADFEQDRQFLADTIARIAERAKQQHFPLVEDDKPCRYCVYRSFCDRGIQAGPLLEQVEAEPEAVDLSALEWDQIAEIQF
ncbi:MAG: PD-(D/E)XK nuclease family protein, partial [Anaerolineae bacterium]|nr:PD-(D/E)XK nuclease family protein [Anaerolineae bacterium]